MLKDKDEHNAYMRAYYHKNKDKALMYVKKYKERLSKKVRKMKDVPCKDCSKRYPHYVMDFDHVRGLKLFTIGNAVQRGTGFEKIKAEIKKCEVVCANCHRERTWGGR